MIKARQSKEEIMDQIKALNTQKPIDVNDDDLPTSLDDLKEIFERLNHYDEEQKPVSKFELKTMFDKLEAHYEEFGTEATYQNMKIPITWGEIKSIYDHMGNQDDLDLGLNSRSYQANASIVDLTLLISRLSEAYASGTGKIKDDLDEEGSELLIKLFDTMADFYSIGLGQKVPQANDLYYIYNTLARVYGKKSDFDLDDDKLEVMYEELQ